jgi:hypothetical protein
MKISAELKKVSISVNQNALLSPLQEMPASIPFPVDVVGIGIVYEFQRR